MPYKSVATYEVEYIDRRGCTQREYVDAVNADAAESGFRADAASWREQPDHIVSVRLYPGKIRVVPAPG